MAKSKTIRVTPNAQKCLEELKAALKSMPAGDLKLRAQGSIDYLSQTFKGKPQLPKGIIFEEKIESDKLFGTHIAEAKNTIKKIFKK